MEIIKQMPFIITDGRNKHIDRPYDICPTLLAGISHGYSTFGIPGVVEIWK